MARGFKLLNGAGDEYFGDVTTETDFENKNAALKEILDSGRGVRRDNANPTARQRLIKPNTVYIHPAGVPLAEAGTVTLRESPKLAQFLKDYPEVAEKLMLEVVTAGKDNHLAARRNDEYRITSGEQANTR